MKKIILILALAFISCKEAPKEQHPPIYESKYSYGTIMYLKPDSLKVVITGFDENDNTYQAYWREGGEYEHNWFSEEWFFGEADTLKYE
jgi:hypothetical protein